MLCITTDIPVASRGRFTLTELDQEALFRPVAKSTHVVDRGDRVPLAVREAFRQVTTGRPGAAHLGLPLDVQRETVDASAVHADPEFARVPALRIGPHSAAIRAAAAVLAHSRQPALVVGGGVLISGASRELRMLAEKLGAVVCTTVSGKGSLAETHPLVAGVIGSNGGTLPTRTVIDSADVVVFIGCRAGSVTTEKWRHPLPGSARVIHIDVDPRVFGVNYPTGVAIQADAQLALHALGSELGVRASWRKRSQAASRAVAQAKVAKFSEFRRLAGSNTRPITRSSSPTPVRPAPISRHTTNCGVRGAISFRIGRTARWATRCRRRSALILPAPEPERWRSWATAASVSPAASSRPSSD
jgi:acetolactate synthase-1/2/3 large subunit